MDWASLTLWVELHNTPYGRVERRLMFGHPDPKTLSIFIPHHKFLCYDEPRNDRCPVDGNPWFDGKPGTHWEIDGVQLDEHAHSISPRAPGSDFVLRGSASGRIASDASPDKPRKWYQARHRRRS